MGANMMVNGKQTICMVTEYTLGRTVEDMKATIRMTRNMERASTSGPMASSTTASGEMESSTEKARLRMRMVTSGEDSGRMERGRSGSISEMKDAPKSEVRVLESINLLSKQKSYTFRDF